MRVIPGVALVCFISSLAYCAEPGGEETPRAKEAEASAGIDRLILRDLKSHELRPNAPASDNQFVRRVYLDVIDQHADSGVLITEDVVVRSSNGIQHPPLFNTPLSEGIEFDIVDERSNWLQIVLPNGQTGWIEKQDAQIVTLNRYSINTS